jgi:DNA polymerase III delta subunit
MRYTSVMLYLFHGADVAKTRAKAFQWVAAARAKEPNASYIRLDAAVLTESTLHNALSAHGLFFTKTLVLLDDPFSETEAGELVLAELKLLASSDNPVALLAPKLIATRLKKIEPHATKVFEQSAADKKPARGFNSGLVNALGAKDGKGLWKEIIKAHRQGDAPEMIHGLLHWKARDLMQKGSTRWKPGEARALSRALIELVSDSRSGALELSLALERFALEI